MLWTFQPKREQSIKKHLPFNTWEVQDELIEVLIDGIRNGGDLLVDKSREMGATVVILGCYFVEWLLMPDTTLLIASRKEEYVWKKGNPDTLYWKLIYMHKNLPLWVQPPLRQGRELSERHMLNPVTNAVIDGESTNADLGAGGRRQSVFCDEFSRVNPPDAESIAETISDTTPCRIFASTPTSRGHPFGKLRFSTKIPVFTMAWYRHPWKKRGLYRSPDINTVIILDIEYYQQRWPEVFNQYKNEEPIKYSDLEKQMLFTVIKSVDKFKLGFVADGNDKLRSPWYDREDKRRTPRDRATNIDIDYVGSGDMVFTADVLRRMIEEGCRPPDVEGELKYRVFTDEILDVKLERQTGRNRFKWWGPLAGSRPPQHHNYIVGCDISMGTGQSNSVASIYDCDTHIKCGRWTCPNTSPTHFAELAVALGKWVGGSTGKAFLIWESNGPGQIFAQRVNELGYDFIYRTREEKIPSRRRKRTPGWYSSGDNKLNMLSGYDAALDAHFKRGMETKAFFNPDVQALREAEDYIFYPSGKGTGPSSCQADEGGAKAAHGDIVIADGLCCLARWDQPRASIEFNPNGYKPVGSFAYRRNERQIADREKQEDGKWLI